MRVDRHPTIFDYLHLSAKERSQAPLVLPRTGTPVHEQVNKTKAWDNVKERKLQRLMHEFTHPS